MSLLKSSGLFVVSQDDKNYAISTDVLKEYIAPLAKQELGDPYSPGHPGVIMPGDGFVYDESTGLLEINIPSGLVYVGLIGSDALNDEVLEPDPYGDIPGHFYIVSEEVTLCNDVWPGITNDPSGCKEVHINDKVIMNNDEEWDVIPAITEDFIHVGPTPPNDPDEGNLWWESEIEKELYIWVLDAYGNGTWVPVADHPPVIISPTPPDFNNSSDGTTNYPVIEGDLWFDSEQLALYVAALDADGDLVWLISTPANRSGIDDEVAANPFVLPASATDRQEEYNPVTDTWYVYNAPKKQWIDFNPNDNPCLEIYGYILKFSALNNPNAIDGPFNTVANISFAIYSQTDYPNNRYNEHYLNDGDGNWQKMEDMDAATLAKYAIASVNKWQVDFWGPATTSGNWVADLETTYPDMSVKGVAIQKDDEGNDLVDENGNVIQVESPAFRIYDDPCASFDIRDLDPTIASCGPGQSPGKRYLLAHGDTVTDAPDTSQYSWNTDTEFLVPEDLSIKFNPETPKDGWGVKLSNNNLDYKLTVGAKNANINTETTTVAADEYVYLVSGSNSINLRSGANGDPKTKIESNQFIVETTEYIELEAAGDITINAGANSGKEAINRIIDDTSDLKQITNKEYVDAQDQILANQIIELEENIDAIAPSVERGVWKMTLSGSTSSRGLLTMYDDTFGQGSPIGIFAQVKSIWFHEEDTAGTPHGFNDVDPGYLLELFVEGEPDYGLFEVVEVHDQTVGSPNPYYAIDVNFVRALSSTAKADPNDLVRMKTFQAPSGGTADGFVLKSGDVVEGELVWYAYKAAEGGNPAENGFNGIKILSSLGGGKVLFEANTGGGFTPETLRTYLEPASPNDITNKKYVDGLWDFSQYTELS